MPRAPYPRFVQLDVLFKNDRILAVNKPPGLLSVPGLGPQNQDCIASRAAALFPGAMIVHRLDSETSGVMVLALDPDTHRRLSMQFEKRRTEKAYVAIVQGQPDGDEGEIDLPIRKDIDNRPMSIVDRVHGKPSVTRWRVIEHLGDRTRLELTPVTGRTHQLRLHLSAVGHPILGDSLYAPAAVRFLAPRLLLHARLLMVTDPGTQERLTFESPVPF